MTGIEMVYNFQALIEDISPKFKEEERLDTHIILDYLNRTQERYIKLKYLGGNSFKENVYNVSKHVDEIDALITMTDTTNPVTFYSVDGMPDEVKSVEMPDNMLSYIRADISVMRDNVLPILTPMWVPVEEIDYNDVDSVLTTPFNTPILEKPLLTMRYSKGNNEFLIIPDMHTYLVDLMITYMRVPAQITMDIDCELSVQLHEEIVKLAVSMFIDEYKTKLQQPKKNN